MEAPDVTILVNGRALTFDVFPRIAKGRVLVPFRAIFGALGADIEWVEAERKIIARKGWLTCEIGIGNPRATLNSDMQAVMEVPPVIVKDRTLVPLRFVSESLGALVRWDSATRTVTITTASENDVTTALDHPHVTVSDASGDFVGGVEGSPPGGTYTYTAADISKISVATNSDNLFIKVQFNGVIPQAPATIEGGNTVTGLSLRIALDTDLNGDTGVKAYKGAEALLAYDANLQASRETASFFSAPSGPGFGRHTIGRIVGGGIGYGYVTLAYYLEDLGLKRGSSFDLYAWSVASTPEWKSLAFDEAPNRQQKEKSRVNIPF
ncbi:MAG: copper amine oxidase N-terminal domain-containing protein [Firmicutes bacterium]|nr:copper amine oxidase N-terminal domain-containing protein [Bacillota bacterium]